MVAGNSQQQQQGQQANAFTQTGNISPGAGVPKGNNPLQTPNNVQDFQKGAITTETGHQFFVNPSDPNGPLIDKLGNPYKIDNHGQILNVQGGGNAMASPLGAPQPTPQQGTPALANSGNSPIQFEANQAVDQQMATTAATNTAVSNNAQLRGLMNNQGSINAPAGTTTPVQDPTAATLGQAQNITANQALDAFLGSIIGTSTPMTAAQTEQLKAYFEESISFPLSLIPFGAGKNIAEGITSLFGATPENQVATAYGKYTTSKQNMAMIVNNLNNGGNKQQLYQQWQNNLQELNDAQTELQFENQNSLQTFISGGQKNQAKLEDFMQNGLPALQTEFNKAYISPNAGAAALYFTPDTTSS